MSVFSLKDNGLDKNTLSVLPLIIVCNLSFFLFYWSSVIYTVI